MLSGHSSRSKCQRFSAPIYWRSLFINVAILAHGIIKQEDRVPDTDIERTLQRKKQFEISPEIYTYVEDVEETNNGDDE